jgi:membrane protein
MGTRVATAGGSPGDRGRHPIERLHSFFAEQIWTVSTANLRRGKALLYRASRVGYSTVMGFVDNRLTVRAAALTYFSVLSVVPFLAFAFAVLKGFGAYASFIDGRVRPYLQETFGGNPALLGAIERILQFVDRTDVSKLGAVGLLILVYTSVSLLSSVEQTLNEIWGAKTTRTFLRQLTDYVTLLVTTPLLILVATTFLTAAQNSDAVLFLRHTLALGLVIDFLLRLTSLVAVGVALLAVYAILPNVHVRPTSALLGAAVGAILWHGALLLYVRFQMGVSSYNALYSVASAVPIFLVWTYISWLIVLVGAQVAAGHQSEQAMQQRFHARRVDQGLKETLAVVAAAHIARDFLSGRPLRGDAALAELVKMPPLTVEEILGALVRSGLLARTSGGPEDGYVPARDLDAIHLTDLQDAVRLEGQADQIRADLERQVGPELGQLLRSAEEQRRMSPQNLTLRQLAALVGDADDARATPAPRSGRAPPGRQEEGDRPALPST